jgi:integrase
VSWIHRFRVDSKAYTRGFGPYPSVGLHEAREKLLAARRALLDGTYLRPKSVTFETAVVEYHDIHSDGWRSAKHAAQWLSSCRRHLFPVLGGKSVDAIGTGDLVRALSPLWAGRRETGMRLLGRIRAAMDYATARGYRQGPNPARWSGNMEHLLLGRPASVKHLGALPYVEIPNFMIELRRRNSIATRALEFTILTAARTGETRGATWLEIDGERRVWAIPATRMKMGREHRVPLCARASDILGDVERLANDRCFPIGENAMLELAKSMAPGVTVHGFRSSFADWCAEQTDFPRDVREMALAHTIGSKVEEAYRRGDLFGKRRQLMEAWAEFCGGKAKV